MRPEDVAGFEALLAEEHDRALVRLAGLERDLSALMDATEASPDDEHDPEGATIGFERAQVTALLDRTRSHLAEIAGARARLADGSYGRCQRCGHAIGTERLRARPTARRCIGCAEVTGA